ncbi:MAG: hypothetical protein SF339_00095 [Blastocatellia bacterium]|nr:hypothetical protein [Blastocatellia bacterium]
MAFFIPHVAEIAVAWCNFLAKPYRNVPRNASRRDSAGRMPSVAKNGEYLPVHGKIFSDLGIACHLASQFPSFSVSLFGIFLREIPQYAGKSPLEKGALIVLGGYA